MHGQECPQEVLQVWARMCTVSTDRFACMIPAVSLLSGTLTVVSISLSLSLICQCAFICQGDGGQAKITNLWSKAILMMVARDGSNSRQAEIKWRQRKACLVHKRGQETPEAAVHVQTDAVLHRQVAEGLDIIHSPVRKRGHRTHKGNSLRVDCPADFVDENLTLQQGGRCLDKQMASPSRRARRSNTKKWATACGRGGAGEGRGGAQKL